MGGMEAGRARAALAALAIAAAGVAATGCGDDAQQATDDVGEQIDEVTNGE